MKIIERCPISADTIEETHTRFIAGFVLSLSLTYLWTGWVALPLFLAADFALRAYAGGRFSLLKSAGLLLVRLLGLKERQVNAGPKLFAARMGSTVTGLMVVFHLLGLHFVAEAMAVAISICAALQAAVAFCVGCKIYSVALHFAPGLGTRG